MCLTSAQAPPDPPEAPALEWQVAHAYTQATSAIFFSFWNFTFFSPLCFGNSLLALNLVFVIYLTSLEVFFLMLTYYEQCIIPRSSNSLSLFLNPEDYFTA